MIEGWRVHALSKLATVSAGNPAPQDKALFQDGQHPFIRTADVGRIRFGEIDSTSDYLNDAGIAKLRRFPRGTILLPKSGASTFLNHRVMMGIDGYVASHLSTIQADEEKIHPWFLLYFLHTIVAQDLVQDHNYPSLNLSLIKSIQVPLPSLPEQEQIVAILDEAFAALEIAIANTEKNLSNLKEVAASSSQRWLVACDEKTDRYTLAQLIDLGWIVGHMDGNHGSDYPRKSEFINAGVPYISANCIEGDSVNMARAKYLSPDRASKLRKGFAQNRDVLFAHNATVGPVAILETEHPTVILGTSLTYYRCNTEHILPEYLAHYMRSPEFVRQYEQVMRQSTRNQVPITKQRTFTYAIPPIEAQRKIASRLDGLSRRITLVERAYSRKRCILDELIQSILQKAFTGKLTADATEADRTLSEAGL